MKTALRNNHGDIVFRELPLPPVGPNDIRLAVKACGICGSDIHGGAAHDKEFRKFGHEVAGIVIETGCGVNRLKIGDAVALDSATPCGQCPNCRNKDVHLCTDIQSFFFYDCFGFAEEIVAPAICAMKIAELDFAEATLQEPLGVALDMVKLADVKPGMNALVIGIGPIGAMALPLLRLHGVNRLFVSDFPDHPRRAVMAGKFAVDACIAPDKLAGYEFGCRIDRVLVTAPPAVLPAAMAAVSEAGIISYIGIGYDKADITFNADDFHFRKLQLRASFASPAHYGAEALELLRRKTVDPALFISHRFPFAELETAFRQARSGDAMKVVVEI